MRHRGAPKPPLMILITSLEDVKPLSRLTAPVSTVATQSPVIPAASSLSYRRMR